jgi:ribonuclease PH
MSPSALPAAELSHLPKSDGSATFSYQGYTITTAVNGPVEAQRRDENAFEALVDVNVRPAAGVGGMSMCKRDLRDTRLMRTQELPSDSSNQYFSLRYDSSYPSEISHGA